jgi:ParB family chromosome partitioning protein
MKQMSMKINAGEIGRQDVYLIDPENIVVVEGQNTRWQPHDDVEVAALARSFETEGQLQPVVVRRIADNRVQLVAGFRRYHAAQQYNLMHTDAPMKLKCVVSIMNDEEALRRSIAENRERAETTPMDDAFSQRRLRDECGWTDTKIAEFYKVSPPYVGTLKKLLMLPREIQLMVHSQQISVQAAVAMTELSAEEQKAVVAPEPSPSPETPVTHVSSATVIKRTREKKIQQGKKQARSLKEVKDFLETLVAPNLKAFAETFLKFIQGTYTDATMEKKLKGFLVSLPDEAPAGLEATAAPDVPAVVEAPVETTEATVSAVPESISFPVVADTTPFPLVDAA